MIACALIAERNLPTLILAHSKPLLEQWRSRLQTLLGLPSKQIGQRGGGRRKLTGVVDLAMIQSLKTIDDLEAFFAGYGLVVIDECHHLPAFSLFLAFPVSFKGRLVQYAGRLMRTHDGKTSVRIYDYADLRVPVLRAMHGRRLRTYKSLGFSQLHEQAPALAISA